MTVETSLSGTPLRVTTVTIHARIEADNPELAHACFVTACPESTIPNSAQPAFPVTFELADEEASEPS